MATIDDSNGDNGKQYTFSVLCYYYIIIIVLYRYIHMYVLCMCTFATLRQERRKGNRGLRL